MKKLLLSLAMILGMAPVVSVNAATEPTLTQEWLWGGEGWGDGWDGAAPNWSSTDAIKSKACTRFATAFDGKVYLLNMKTMSIAQVTADGVQDLYKLPSLEGQSMNDVADYYGTSITSDQAGNFLIGHFFTKAPQCVLRYTIYSPSQNKAKTFTLDVPTGMAVSRMDCMGRVLGDLTKKAYAYIAPGNFVPDGTYATNQKVRVLTFAGDGDVDNVTVSSEFSGMVYLAATSTVGIAQPIYSSMEEAEGVPATSTFINASSGINANTKLPGATFFGFTATGAENWGYSGLGGKASTALNGFDTFKLGDKTFYALNYLETYDADKQSPMSVAIYDAAFNYVTSWTNPDYSSKAGYSTIVAEPVDATTANIYIFNSTGNLNGETKQYGCAAQLKFNLEAEAFDGVVFEDDFEWLEPWSVAGEAGETVQTDNLDAKAPALTSVKMDVDGVETTCFDFIESKGYTFIYDKDDNKRTYLQRNYLKFGKTGNHSGIVLPALDKAPGNETLTLSFDWCPMRQGSGKIDPVNLYVLVENGAESKRFDIPACGWENGHVLEWIHAVVVLDGVTVNKDTKITITETQWNVSTANRYFLDNIKVIVTSSADAGSRENPYVISTPEDLGDMHAKIAANAASKVYFTLANDIDMEGVKDYKPAIGYNQAYAGSFDFDGKNHIIRNFAPDATYAYMSIFGVIRGDVRNLGVENCNVVSNTLGAGALGGYGSQGGVDCVLENVWATGSVTGNGVYAGGLVGTNGNNLTIKNCYFNGDVIGSYAGGLVGRARAGVTIENSYAAGEVAGSTNAGGIAGTDKAGLDLTLSNVVAWNTSVAGAAAAAVTTLNYAADQVKVFEGMTVNGQAVEGGVSAEALAAEVTAWAGWNQKLKDGYPALAWEEIKGALGSEDNPFVVATVEDLNGLKAQFSLETPNYVVLEADLDMTDAAFTPFYPTAGNGVAEIHFDGKNHVISNLNAVSLFGYFHGSVKNLGLENVNAIAGGWDPSGIIASYAYVDATVENCFATGAVQGFYAGGLIGGVQNESSLTIKNCYANVNVTSTTGYAGGLVAPTNKAAHLTIENAYVAGNVVGKNVAGGISAGFNFTAGWHEGSSITIKNAVSFCNVVTATVADAIVAQYPDLAEVTYDIANAYTCDATLVNDVAVEDGLGKYDLINMVLGWEGFNEKLLNGMPALAWQDANETLVTIATADDLVALKDKVSDGDLTVVLLNDLDMTGVTFAPANLNGKGAMNFDGQFHVISNLTTPSAIFDYFHGTLRNLGVENVNAAAGGWGVGGGIATYLTGETTVENCYTTGEVKGFYAGGIAGGVFQGADVTIRNCYSLANVAASGAQSWGGGIVGPVNETGKVTIENCYAAGSVDNPNGAGGIAAGANTNYANDATVVIKNCVAWNPSVNAGDANASYTDGNVSAFVPASAHLVTEIADCEYWNMMTLKSAAVEGGKSTEELQTLVTSWEAYNDKLSNGMPVLAWQEASGEIVEQGTEENPYKITTPADLCAMHKQMVAGKTTYYVLENDIDMADVKDYVPAIGSDGKVYIGEINFDGQNHVIKNFAPDAKYYYMSLFGVLRGTVRNLGVQDCEIVSELGGAGVLGGYAGHDNIATTIDNVWATGSVTSTAYAGGLAGTNSAALTITNSYFNGDVEGTIVGGLVGRVRADLTIEYAYAAGTVSGTLDAAGIAGTDRELSIVLNNVIAWNTKVEGATAQAVTKLGYDAATVKVLDGMLVNEVAVTDGTDVKTLREIATAWEAYADYTVNGMPILKWQEGTPDEEGAVEGVAVDTLAAPVYYNLQGVRVENPGTGIYIVKRGTLVQKVVIR